MNTRSSAATGTSSTVGETVPQRAEGAAQESRGSSESVAPPRSRRLRLAKIAGTHALVFLVALSLFAAADSWSTVSGLGIAGFLCLITGALAGISITTLVHEWFHYLGARLSGATYDIPTRQGLFVYDWDFSSNNLQQFLFVSIAGSVGGFLSVIFLWNAVPADSWGRAALRSAAIASVVFAAFIEWPVIRRARRSGDPLAELSKIDQPLLSRSFIIASVTGIVMTIFFAP